MELKEIHNLVKSEKYSFLRNNEHLQDNVILLTLGGSYAYGTNVEGSDIDVRGIAIERKSEILGLQNFEQFINHETDTTIYALRKIVSLMLNCNPNVIEMLGTIPEHLLYCNEIGHILRDNIDLFLSKRAIASFGGYSHAQLKRLESALARDEYPQEEKEKHILSTLNTQMAHFRKHYTSFDENSIKLNIDKSDKFEFEKEIFMDINLKHYPLRDFKSIYSEMSNIIKEYGKLNHRNKKKDELHLRKHCLHLVRLLEMGAEVLERGQVNTFRENRDFLLNIRNGRYSYEEIFEIADRLEKRFQYASDNTDLPAKPNYKKVEELLVSIYEKRFGL